MPEYHYSYEIIPDDPAENKLWREKTIDYCSRDHPDARKLRELISERCRKDFWYFAYGFCCVHEPRVLDDNATEFDTKVPFLPWPHQIPVVDHILKVLGKRDVRLVKSRAQGASWLVVLIAIWLWLFRRGAIVNFVSKDLDAADKPGDMNSLGAKLDWLIGVLPEWMVGEKRKDWNRNRTDHTFTRADGETVIAFFACTANVATGGRALVFFMDEHGKHPRPQDKDAMASTQPITRCRVCLSTPFGMDGEFSKIIHDKTIEEPVLTLAWWDNPTQNSGLYRIVKGKPKAVDKEKYGPLPEKYLNHENWDRLKARLNERGYDLTNDQFRSQWYDEESLRQGADPVLIAQEYDMNFGMSVSRYFADALVNRLLNQCVRPRLVGEFYVDPKTLMGSWSENPDGRFKLWTELDIRRRPPLGEYIVACDIAAGGGGDGSSNSSITVLDRRIGKKVFGFASPLILPYELAKLAVALCRWFTNYSSNPAYLVWEANGPGGKEFQVQIERTNFLNYFRRKPKDAMLHERNTGKPGYWTQKRSDLLGPYRQALLEGNYDNPDKDAIEELRQYERDAAGEPFHVAAKNKKDSSGAGAAHGDRCFVAGTLIMTEHGERPIEQLSPGDLVWTRDGLRPVLACGKTGEEHVLKVELSNGRSLIGTGSHPVWTENKSWVDLSSLTRSDTLLAWAPQHPQGKEQSCQQNQYEGEYTSATRARKPSCSTGESTTATLMPSRSIEGGTSGAGVNMGTERRSRFTLPSGSTIMDLFRKGDSYITRMTTRAITIFRILHASLLQNTERFTVLANTLNGIAIKRSTTTSANSAVQPTNIGKTPEIGFVAPSVQTNTFVTAVRPFAGKRAVYNLSVAETPEYFAQGVLVHNCISDAIAWYVSLTLYDQYGDLQKRKNINVMNVQENDVAKSSTAFRRAQYLKDLSKQKLKSNW